MLMTYNASPLYPSCRVIAWEVTRRCNLACVHCRASARDIPYENELNTYEALALIDSFPSLGHPLIIFTGGEPLLRPDLFRLIEHARSYDLRCAVSVNGTLLSAKTAQRLKDVGVARCSISLDGADAATHDEFRAVAGAFEGALLGIESLKNADLPFQINTTITPHNLWQLPQILQLCKKLGAAAWHVFLLVPVGRGTELHGISPVEYEQALNWIYKQAESEDIEIKPTCAPQYNRIASKHRNVKNQDEAAVPRVGHGKGLGRGCLGGVGFCFISHTGQVQPCGYLELDCGNIRRISFKEIWQSSQIFTQLRQQDKYPGKCGPCKYHKLCAGCRARAFEQTGDYLEDDPICLYKGL